MLADVHLRGSSWSIGESTFTAPVRVLETREPDEVISVMDEAESEARRGNWVAGLVSYDAAPGFDPALRVPGRWPGPLVWFGVYPRREQVAGPRSPKPTVGEWEPSMSRADHADRVRAIKKHIAAGDTYQANLTMAMTADATGSALGLLDSIVATQPNSYAGVVDLGSNQVVSASPELFLAVEDGQATMRPMKGTAPRGRSSADDRAMRRRLLASDKERSGNVMIVDMLRSDLGRVCRTGTVDVPVLFHAEQFPTVWQLTSTVTGMLSPGVGLAGLFRATFPSGSVTGAPKVSTMNIISELETVPRGVYCGAIGYVAPGAGSYEFSVAIRTGVLEGGRLRYHVGGGITADSEPEVEYDECLWKALVVTDSRHAPDLLESMRYEPASGIRLLEGHLRRLSESAAYWGIPINPTAIGEALSALEASRPVKVRLCLLANGDVEVETQEIDDLDDPVQLAIGANRIDPSEPHWYHKTVERSRYPEPDEGEVVLVNLEGEVTETNISNLMVRFGDRWVTPPVGSGCLPGVYRQGLLDRGEVVERAVSLDDLGSADEIAVTNAVRGWRKAVLVG